MFGLTLREEFRGKRHSPSPPNRTARAFLRSRAHARSACKHYQPRLAFRRSSVDLFDRSVELPLQRELKHKGGATGDGSHSAELIGCVEIIGRVA